MSPAVWRCALCGEGGQEKSGAGASKAFHAHVDAKHTTPLIKAPAAKKDGRR